jgi:hypothetical protein
MGGSDEMEARMTPQSSLKALFSSGHAVDLVLAVVALELLLGVCILGRPRAKLDLLFALAPGFLLLLALRAALTGAGALWVAAFLTTSFPIHLIDLARRRVWSRHAP